MSTPKKHNWHWLHIIGNVLSWALLALTVAAAILLLIPSILGLKLYAITSGSMTGTIDRGALSYEKVVPVADLAVGDIITYQPPPDSGVTTLVTHRLVLVSKTESGERVFQTKGDANETADPWEFTLTADKQPRYIFNIPYLGYLMIWLGGPASRFLLLLIPAVGIAAMLIIELIRMARGKRAARRTTPAAA